MMGFLHVSAGQNISLRMTYIPMGRRLTLRSWSIA